jgi:hypothetical protein
MRPPEHFAARRLARAKVPLAATPETIEVGEYGIEFRVETPVPRSTSCG